MSQIKLEDINYYHGKDTPYEIRALKDISAEIPEKKITGIIGHTGSGKSTLVQLFNGILKPYSGRVLIDTEDIWAKPKEIKRHRYKVGLVMQYPEYQLFEDTIYKDIAFGPKNMGLSNEEIKERVYEAARFSGLDVDLLEKSPFDISGGQKRRAAIAGIIAMRPDILVLDEPAAGLDPKGRDDIFSNIKNYQAESGNTVIIVSHSMEDMARLCDNLIVMLRGEIAMTGTCDEVFSRAEELGGMGLDVPQITKLMKLLSDKGIDVPRGIYTVDQALYALTEIKNK